MLCLCVLVAWPGICRAGHGCLSCHAGIEPISSLSPMKELACQFCHRGHPEAASREDAHSGMWANPSDYRVADKTCGQCHAEILARSRKSLHATSAGIISATRYTWAAQKTKNALYANYAVRDKDGDVPADRGALPRLDSLPSYRPSVSAGPFNSPADDYLREECLRCHLYSYGMERPGDFRSSGCAACHMPYGDDGRYKGNDRAVSLHGRVAGSMRGWPIKHRLTRIIPPAQCIHCHNRGGRTGVSFIGTMESDGYGSPWSGRPGKKGAVKLHGKDYNHLQPDVHFEKGLYCVDCHTEQDCHGDGNIYSKKEQAVEIECQDCHGTATRATTLKTSWGNPIDRLQHEGSKVVLVSVTGERHPVPQVKTIIENGPGSARAAMGISGHMQALECYACHSRWAPQCYGCHAQQDCTTRSHDWLQNDNVPDETMAGRAVNAKKACCKWRETRSYLRWESPALGINAEGRVSPFIPGCQVFFTGIGPDGRTVALNKVFTTYDGLSGIATNPIQPHTVSARARSCQDCHANPKALGLGTGIYRPKANGLGITFELERIVSDNGTQIQATSHDRARPFSREELQRIRRIGTCVSCHARTADKAFWDRVKDTCGMAGNDTAHGRILRQLLECPLADK